MEEKEKKKFDIKEIFKKEEKSSNKKPLLSAIGPSNFVIILLVGIFLLILSFPPNKTPDKKTDTANQKETDTNQNNVNSQNDGKTEIYVEVLEKRLEDILSKVEGIGSVEVMISLKGSKELVILKDSPYKEERINETDGEGGSRITSSLEQEENTIMIEGDDGTRNPYVLKELEPQVEGIVIIAEGGNNSIIINQIVEASQVLFGVPAHKVKVMKMN
jgi:stage III sporulation protein AG